MPNGGLAIGVSGCNSRKTMNSTKTDVKKLWLAFAWFLGGAILGQLAGGFLFRLWAKALPVSRWLDPHDSEAIFQFWIILWLNAVPWILAAVAGVIRGLFEEDHLLSHLVLFGLGFVFVPLALFAYLNSRVPGFDIVAEHTPSIGLAIFFGLLSHRLAHFGTQKRIEKSGTQ